MHTKAFIGALIYCALPFTATAQNTESRIGISYLNGLGDTVGQYYNISETDGPSVSYSRKIDEILGNDDEFTRYISISYNELNGNHAGEEQTQRVTDITIRAQRPLFKGINIEAKIGIAHLSNRDFFDATIDTRLNFALGAAISYRINKNYDVAFDYKHYSNARTNRPNMGLDFIGLGIRRYF